MKHRRGATRPDARARTHGGSAAAPAAWIAWTALAVAVAADAAPSILTLDPAATSIRFELDATLHRVEGSAALVGGVVHFDTDGGQASGLVEIDARSVDTGNGLRDGALHEDVLESERFPRVLFVPEHVALLELSGDEARVELRGRITIHGDEHEVVIPAKVRAAGDDLVVELGFELPYVEWGMQNPGNFLLSVGDVVNLHFEAKGRITPPLR